MTPFQIISNPLVKSVEYCYDRHELRVKVGKFRRTYSGVPGFILYKLIQAKTPSELMSIYSTEIKGIFKVKEVTNK